MPAAFLALALPGLYVAVTTLHPGILPTNLILALKTAREGVPFPSVLEVLILELAFELLREAGLRMPGPVGNTIGIVGGLIIGQAAVSANLVSPMVVVIVARRLWEILRPFRGTFRRHSPGKNTPCFFSVQA